MGLYGVLVVTTPPVAGAAGAAGTPGLAYPVTGAAAGGVTYDADVVALESELDPRQNNMVAALFPVGGATGSATANSGFSETTKWTHGLRRGNEQSADEHRSRSHLLPAGRGLHAAVLLHQRLVL